MKPAFIVYALRDPFTFERRYIGFTGSIRQRFNSHKSRNATGRNPKLDGWMKSLHDKGVTPVFEVLFTFTDENQALAKERSIIRKHAAKLLNVTHTHTPPKPKRRYVNFLPVLTVKEINEMMSPTMPCPICKGTGVIKLPKLLTETLLLFYRFHGGFTAEEIHRKENSQSTVNAVNNRLEKLRRLEYLKRRREGKCWRYFRTKKRGVQRAIDHR